MNTWQLARSLARFIHCCIGKNFRVDFHSKSIDVIKKASELVAGGGANKLN